MTIRTTPRSTKPRTGNSTFPLYVRGRHRSEYLARFALTEDDQTAIVAELQYRGGDQKAA